ncbi:MAG: serine/threonine-protein kinase, partial [Pedobacter sp.]
MNYGRYQIIREVGRGAMGVVYEARDPNIGRVVALKVLRQDRITTEKFVNRFLKEAKVVGRLSHPRIVTIYDVGEDQGTIYIAMEFLEGIPLSDLINNKRFDADEVIELGIKIASALEYAHQKGVVHRDIKPSNIIVSPDGQIKITDFGIAHIEDATATLQTQAGEIMGTPAYMSPEQVQGNPVDCRSDLFSLGIILYELSTGTRPFGGEGKGLATIFNEIMLVTPHEPHKESPPIPKGLSKIIMKALEKEPGKRFQSGMELANAL